LVALQKLLALEDIKQETQTVEKAGEPAKVDALWPKQGSISFKNVQARYRPETDLVLKKLNFDVEPGHKVGVVGRTAAGKSTLCLVLSRIIECESGSVEIDGVESATIPLETLR
jgi:ABC-type multidrug transport system fused ATPase/permease subunit